MKYNATMLVVKDIEKSKQFYKNILGLRVKMDLGVNVTLTGGVALQTQNSWKEFINKGDDVISYGGNNFELYFEETDFDVFIIKLKNMDNLNYVHPVFEHTWGQRVVRFYDPDGHIIEVGESLKVVCKRFLETGMTPEQVAKRMDVPLKMVKAYIK
ncbi:MAG: VOC family protein [Clostridia bacterium]